MAELKSGKIQTVLGLIDENQLGTTLPHEHLFIELGLWFKEPSQSTRKLMSEEKIRIDHPDISWFKYHPYSNKDNLRLLNEKEAVYELMRFKAVGGNSIVDVTLDNIGRDPAALARVSRLTGINVVMGCGYYVGEIQVGDYDQKTVEDITAEIIHDIEVGVGIEQIKAGIIGEIGCSWPLDKRERKSLIASAHAQAATGTAITVHPGRHADSPLEIIDILKQAGADLEKVIICHIDRTPFSLETRLKIAETGCSIEYDLFGWEGYYPLEMAIAHMPNDVQRIKEILEMKKNGYLNQVLISHDICYKTRRYTYGGHGYTHILENSVPVMKAWDLSDNDIDALLIHNAKRLIAFR